MEISVRTPVRGCLRRRAAGAGLAALLLAAGAVSCGKGAESPGMTPAAAVAAAARNTATIDSLHYRMTGQIPGQGRLEGEARMRMKPALAMSMKMTVAVQGENQTVELRLVDKAMYLDGGAEAAQEMHGKRWMKIDMSAAGAGGAGLDQLGGAAQAEKNPATESELLTGAKDVRKIGSETVDGVKTTHYRGTATLDDLRAELEKQNAGKGADVQKKQQQSLDGYEKLGVSKLTMDQWVDAQQHTKQFRLRGAAAKGPLDLTMTFLDFNKPVDVTAPPAAETTDMAELLKGAGAA
ncbi:DUF1396 domain-containing protein [Streptomyces sp. NPDC047017]|uniref:DUF1396 domain-containing protein n=1 Tax=Streptomyces sp. NPDC047017 TaxID=3155024 RepID=UPI0033D59F4D